jgi:hypothetical protein
MAALAQEGRRKERPMLPVAGLVLLLVTVLSLVAAPMVRPIHIPVGTHEVILLFTQASRVRAPIPQGLRVQRLPMPQTVWTLRFGDGVYFVFWQSQETSKRIRQMSGKARGSTRIGP